LKMSNQAREKLRKDTLKKDPKSSEDKTTSWMCSIIPLNGVNHAGELKIV
jgi:hypothetical protein